MTEQDRDMGRIDLRALDASPSNEQANRVISAALARALPRPKAGVLWSMNALARPVFAVAALLLLVAGSLIVLRGRREGDTPSVVLANWAESGHVPTNGELLATFQGYAR